MCQSAGTLPQTQLLWWTCVQFSACVATTEDGASECGNNTLYGRCNAQIQHLCAVHVWQDGVVRVEKAGPPGCCNAHTIRRQAATASLHMFDRSSRCRIIAHAEVKSQATSAHHARCSCDHPSAPTRTSCSLYTCSQFPKSHPFLSLPLLCYHRVNSLCEHLPEIHAHGVLQQDVVVRGDGDIVEETERSTCRLVAVAVPRVQ